MRQTVGILGTPIDILDTEEVLARLEQFIEERRFHQVATANTDFLINALSDPELRSILRNADLVMPDGMPVVWAAKLMRSALPERVTGADIVPELAALAARKGYRVYMLGARPDVAKAARQRLEADYPGLQIVGCVQPPIAPLVAMDSETLLDDIARARPDILLVAFGNPKQEKWISMHRERLSDVPVCIGVGGTFDFLAGMVPRAPVWMQQAGIEWCYRLLHEPRRLWRRYFRDISQFSRYLLKQWWAVRRGKNVGRSELYMASWNDCMVLSLEGDFSSGILPRVQALAENAFNNHQHLILDFQGVKNFDGAALGTLINLPKRAAYCGCDVRLVALPAAIRKALRRSQLNDGLFQIYTSIAQAFTHGRAAGIYWQVCSSAKAAVVTVCGAYDRTAILNLEKKCAQLLRAGKRVDLDARGLTYADCFLLATLYRLTDLSRENGMPPRFRIVPGTAVRETMQREKMLDNYVLMDTPEMPSDAVAEAAEIIESESSEERATVEPLAAWARGVG